MIPLPTGVKLGTYDKPKLLELQKKLAHYCFYFGNIDLRNTEEFVQEFFSRNMLMLELPYGLVMIRELIEDERAEVHISCFDHKLSAHTDDLIDCLTWGFLQFNLQRVETFVQDFMHAVRRFLEDRLHFTHEGILRKRSLVRGKFRDVYVYGLLRDEILGGKE